MTVVVTGVTSFIGIYTARALLKTGDRVIGVVRPESHNLLKLTQAGITKDENFRLVRFDFDDLPEPEAGEEHYRAVLDEGIGSHIIDVWLHMSWDGVGSVGRSDNDMQIRNVQNAKKAYLMAKVLFSRAHRRNTVAAHTRAHGPSAPMARASSLSADGRRSRVSSMRCFIPIPCSSSTPASILSMAMAIIRQVL